MQAGGREAGREAWRQPCMYVNACVLVDVFLRACRGFTAIGAQGGFRVLGV